MPLTQLECDVSQLQVERQTVLIFICTALFHSAARVPHKSQYVVHERVCTQE